MWTPIAFKINCGYARTAIREHRRIRACQFRRPMRPHALPHSKSYILHLRSHKISESNGSHNTIFDDNCVALLKMFRKRWNPHSRRIEYETFSIANWKSLAKEKQREHTLSNCASCSQEFPELQAPFPGKPIYIAPTTSLLALPEQQGCSKKVGKQEGRRILGELNQV